MLYFLVSVRDREGSAALRTKLRPEHLDYWRALGESVKVAGAILSSTADDAVPIGSSLLIEAESEGAVRDMLAADPFTIGGVFGADVSIQRLRPSVGAWVSAP
jgi:uncharacterized protein YciI